MTIYCLECNKEFEQVRSTARFCGAVCRVEFNRRRDNQIAKQFAKENRGDDFTTYNSDNEAAGSYKFYNGRLRLSPHIGLSVDWRDYRPKPLLR